MYICTQVHSLRNLIWRNFNHGSSIYLPRIKIIINDGEDDNSACHQTSEIHVRSVWIYHCRKEAKSEHDDTIPHPEGIKEDAPDTRNAERTPNQFIRMPGGAGHLAGLADCSSDAVPEEKGLGEDIGGVEAADADGDDVVESGCGTNVDQADGAGNAGHDHDCVHRDSGVCLDL